MTQHPLPNLKQIQENRTRLGDLVMETPTFPCNNHALRQAAGGADLFFKLELFQHGGSFKPRGALSVMLDMTPDQLNTGVTAISAGNHAIAVGYAARVMGTSAKVVMPKTANGARVKRCREQGSEIVLTENVHLAFEEVHRIEKEEGRLFVHPFEGPLTALGTASVGLELCQQAGELDAVIVPIGGGGLCAGISAAVKLSFPNARVIGVEPFGADTMTRSFASGKCETIPKVTTIADSLGAPHAAPYSFHLCQTFVDEIVRIDDDAMCAAMALLFDEMKLAVEPAGAAATAALCGPLKGRFKDKKVGVIVCGSNIDGERFNTYLTRGFGVLANQS